MYRFIYRVLMKFYRLIVRRDRWCFRCGNPIDLCTSEIYDPVALNPNKPPFYFELCADCGKQIHKTIKDLIQEGGRDDSNK